MRKSVADYEVIADLPAAAGGRARYLCRAPGRLRLTRQTVMATEVAVDAAGWPEFAERVARFAAVPSDNLLGLIEAGPDLDPAAAGVYLVTEAPTGGVLAEAGAGLDDASKVAAVAEAALGAHALHEAGLAHGAIDLRSIVVADRGGALAPPPLDHGPGAVADVVDWRDLAALDPDLLCGELPSRPSDVWALGAALHMALSPRPLYPGIDKDAPVTAVQRVLFTRPSIDPDIPPRVARAIEACLAADPAVRPSTAAELSERLQGVGASA